MPEKVRHFFALLALFGGGFLCYGLWGIPGAAGYGFGISGTVLTLGLASGYWIGFDPRVDAMIMELIKRTKERLAAEDDQGQ